MLFDWERRSFSWWYDVQKWGWNFCMPFPFHEESQTEDIGLTYLHAPSFQVFVYKASETPSKLLSMRKEVDCPLTGLQQDFKISEKKRKRRLLEDQCRDKSCRRSSKRKKKVVRTKQQVWICKLAVLKIECSPLVALRTLKRGKQQILRTDAVGRGEGKNKKEYN